MKNQMDSGSDRQGDILMKKGLNVGERIDIVCPKCDASRFAVRLIGGDTNNTMQLTCSNCNHRIKFNMGEKVNGSSKN